jgi:error-prone DNA polymerase
MVSRGYQADFAERLYQQILGFGEYGFPESHAASFAVLAYVSAWLKYYYPDAFYCALLNSQPMGFYSPSQLLQDARRHGLTILPACINASSWEYTIEAQADNTGLALRLGLQQIKGLRHQSMVQLLAARPSQGFQHSQQLQALKLPNNQLQALASANALQAISGHRYQARWQLLEQGQVMPLFATQHQDDIQLPAPNALAELTEDYQSMHLSLTQHPMALLRQAGLLGGTRTATELHNIPHQRPVTIAGLVTGRQRPGSAAGVTFITLEDETGNTNLVVWQGTARAQRQAYLQARILKVKGILERDKDSQVIHVIAGHLTDCSHLLGQLNIISRDFH